MPTTQDIVQKLWNLCTLDRTLLAKAFRGELVPQDPTDEPADVMLARLRTEREAKTEARPKPSRRKG